MTNQSKPINKSVIHNGIYSLQPIGQWATYYVVTPQTAASSDSPQRPYFSNKFGKRSSYNMERKRIYDSFPSSYSSTIPKLTFKHSLLISTSASTLYWWCYDSAANSHIPQLTKNLLLLSLLQKIQKMANKDKTFRYNPAGVPHTYATRRWGNPAGMQHNPVLGCRVLLMMT